MSFENRRTGRGNWRGQGSRASPLNINRFSSSRTSFDNESIPGDRKIFADLQPTTLSFTKPNAAGAGNVEARDVMYIGSYDWVDEVKPTMIVPGFPRVWSNRATPFQVQPDSGIILSDQDGYRMPKYGLLPLLRAVEHIEAGFDWSSVDFVTDRNNLRKLLRWIGSSKARECKDFRIDTQLAGNGSVLFNRWDKRTKESYGGAKFSTYGYNFETATTTPAAEFQNITNGHHRIVAYNLNGLKLVVRFEVDACVQPLETKSKGTLSDVDALADALSSTSLTSTTKKMAPTIEDKYGLCIRRGGDIVDQSNIAELTTISARRRSLFDWVEAYPQLFLSQTPHHFLGIHERGRFDTVEKQKLGSGDLQIVEESLQEALWKLRITLDMIKELVVKHGRSGRLSLVCQGGELKVYKRSSEDSCLPEDILARFDS